MPNKAPLVLMILDGWGYSEHQRYNAIAQANTPQWDEWWQNYPHMLLNASSHSVGLPEGQMGNSEVGHMHIGAGRIIQQDFTRINQSIKEGHFQQLPVLQELISTLKQNGKTLHLMGLLSNGGVHSHEEHLFNILKLCQLKQFNRVYLHLFLDGRDTSPQSALDSLKRLNQIGIGQIASISGRYYAMDRDQRWERLQPVYIMLTQGQSLHHFNEANEAIASYYKQGISDEFIPPTLIGKTTAMEDGDALCFFNYRSDRARQLTSAFVDPQFSGFKRNYIPQLSYFISMTEYAKNLPTTVLFPPTLMNNTLGELVATQGLKQLRIAETEKYAHVTFFFNGGNEQIFPLEERILIPSPKVATYDIQPEMSAPELTQALIAAIQDQTFDLIICNYANADMVGHTGNLSATKKAIECLDRCMNQVWQALAPIKGQLLITADHGNAEEMYDTHTQQAHTAHTCEPVPLLYIGEGWHFKHLEGSLIDVAPTALTLLGIAIPNEMTGQALLEKDNASN